ncbi:MAG: hypothetical protein M1434_06730 [Chloroflexi bacterium]|nr:hypothetical protein [Chloroflexota bacterium]MCL5274427.1 hypothetical protein [Chloroflexota bacterium]
MAQEKPHKLRHTRFTLLLLFALLFLFAENVIGAGLSIQQAIELPKLATDLSPIYVGAMSAVWAIGFAVCLFGISRLNPWAPRITIVITTLYFVNLWVNRLAFGRSSESFATLGFYAILDAICLALVAGTLAWPGTRRLFADARRYLEWLETQSENHSETSNADHQS